MYFYTCSSARNNHERFLWINGRYDIGNGAFTFLDGTLVPTEVMDLRDNDDNGEQAFMAYFEYMAWRDRANTLLFGFICEKNIAGGV